MTKLELMSRLLVGAAVFTPVLALAQPPGPPDDGSPPSRGRRGGSDRGSGDDRSRPPSRPSLPRSTPIAMASSPPRRSATRRPRSSRSTTTTTGPSTAPNSNRAWRRPGGPDGPPDAPQRGGRFGGPPEDGPDGPQRGGRFGGPPPGGFDGPPGGGRPQAAGRGQPEIGHVIPPFVRDQLALTPRQQADRRARKQREGKLESILTARQLRQFGDALGRGPGGLGGPSGRGPGGRMGRGPGGPPGGGGPTKTVRRYARSPSPVNHHTF